MLPWNEFLARDGLEMKSGIGWHDAGRIEDRWWLWDGKGMEGKGRDGIVLY